MDCPTLSTPSQALPVPVSLAPRAARPQRRRPVRVLVLLSPDGFVEVFGPPELSVLVVNRLDVERPEEVFADAYLDSTLPRTFRKIYWPRNLRATGQVQRRTAADEVDRLHVLHLVRGFREFAKGQRTAPAAIQRARRAAG